MTDEQYLRDLESAAAALGGGPSAYEQLRSLLASLPPGTAPVIRSAGSGQPGAESDAAGAGGVGGSLTLQSATPIGSENQSIAGRIAELFYGNSNLLQDPAVEEPGLGIGSGTVLGTSLTRISPNWGGHYVLNSGTAPTLTLYRASSRVNNANPFDSAKLALDFAATTNTYDIDAYFYPYAATVFTEEQSSAPYMICAARFSTANAFSGSSDMTTFPTQNVYLELYDATGAVVKATSLPFNMGSQLDSDLQRRLWSTYLIDPAFLYGGSAVNWRIRVHYVKATATNSRIAADFGEPTWHFSATELPNPYSPVIAKYIAKVLQTNTGSDSVHRLVIGSSSTDPAIAWGPGNAARDVEIWRTGSKELTIDDNTSDVAPALPATLKVIGALFAQGPTTMDLAITYGAFGPTLVTRTDGAGAISSTSISYDGTGKITSVVTTRFGRTFTLTPTYTGANITSLHRAVT